MKRQSKYGISTSTCREEFEHNVFLTVDEIITLPKDDPILINRIMAMGESLEALRKLPNGRIYLPSVDELVRNCSNMLNWLKYLPTEKLEKDTTSVKRKA